MRRRDLIGLGLGLASSKLFCAPPAAWDLSCDVAVAGGGGAGLSAALAAAQNGASVMLFEKMPRIGGDTLISGGYFNAVDPARQKVQGICDSEALFAAQILKAGAGGNTRIMAETFAHESTVTLAWLEELGMQFLPEVQEIMGSGFPRSHKPVLPRGTGYVRTLSAAAQKLGVLIRTSMPVLRFVFDRERNRVTGLVVMEKGRPLYVEASRGVVAAFGGFGASRELCAGNGGSSGGQPARCDGRTFGGGCGCGCGARQHGICGMRARRGCGLQLSHSTRLHSVADDHRQFEGPALYGRNGGSS